MTCHYPPLPFLPGFTINNNIGKTNFARNPIFEYQNNVHLMIEKIRPDIPGKLHSRYPSIYTKGDVSELPGWIAFNKETLTFDAYFQETLHEVNRLPFQVRKCKIYFFLEDGTIKIVEPRVENSGIPQGTLLSRQRISLPPPKDALFYDIIDFNIGKELEIYGKHFKIVNCDNFTRSFLNRIGIAVSDPINMPEDSYTNINRKFPKKFKYKTDKLEKFIANDRKVLRFYGYWDERDFGGYLHDLIIYFYLVDDTIEIREISNDSRVLQTTLLIKRGKIAKSYDTLPEPGYYDNTITLNVVPNRWGNSFSYVLDPIRSGYKELDLYEAKDLGIGVILNVFGKRVVLTDCDEFTKTYYKATFGITDFTPAKKPIENELIDLLKTKRKLPPWNGYGSHEDSAQYCVSFEPKALTNNVKKFLALDRDGFDSRILRFKASLREKNNQGTQKYFIISYFLSDDTIAINEIKEGFSGPLFMKREKKPLPGQEVYASEPPDLYEAHHLFVGASLNINGFQFVLIDADEYALRYMEINCKQFPKANINLIMEKIKNKLKPIYKDFVADMLPNEQPVIPYNVLRNKIISVMGDDFTEHEMITLARHFSAVCRPTERHSRHFIRQIVITELNRLIWDDLTRLKEHFNGYDIYRTGYLPRNKVYNLLKGSRIPLDKLVLENMLNVLDKNDKCEISGDDLFKFLDHNYCPVKHIAPLNTKNELWWPSEAPLVAGKIVDWCAFIKALDLEHILREKIMPKSTYSVET